MSDKSAYRIAMEAVREKHGLLSSRECEIAETAARAAYNAARREVARILEETDPNAGG